MLRMFALVSLLAALLASAALADTITLRSGESIEGRIVAEVDGAVIVRLDAGGSRKIAAASIARVDKAPTPPPSTGPAPTPTTRTATGPARTKRCLACGASGKAPCGDCRPCKLCSAAGVQACSKCAGAKRVPCVPCKGQGATLERQFVKTGEEQNGIVVKPTGYYRTVSVPCSACKSAKSIPCSRCSASGRKACVTCKGSGFEATCSTCAGSRAVPCAGCEGTGALPADAPNGVDLVAALQELDDEGLTSLQRERAEAALRGAFVEVVVEVLDVRAAQSGYWISCTLEGRGVNVSAPSRLEGQVAALRKGSRIRVAGTVTAAATLSAEYQPRAHGYEVRLDATDIVTVGR